MLHYIPMSESHSMSIEPWAIVILSSSRYSLVHDLPFGDFMRLYARNHGFVANITSYKHILESYDMNEIFFNFGHTILDTILL